MERHERNFLTEIIEDRGFKSETLSFASNEINKNHEEDDLSSFKRHDILICDSLLQYAKNITSTILSDDFTSCYKFFRDASFLKRHVLKQKTTQRAIQLGELKERLEKCTSAADIVKELTLTIGQIKGEHNLVKSSAQDILEKMKDNIEQRINYKK